MLSLFLMIIIRLQNTAEVRGLYVSLPPAHKTPAVQIMKLIIIHQEEYDYDQKSM